MQLLTVFETKRRIVLLRLGALLLVPFSVVCLACSLIKWLDQCLAADTSPLVSFSRGMRQLIYQIYSHTQEISWAWIHAPVPNMHELTAAANFRILLLLYIFWVGALMWSSATKLSRRLKEAFRRAEERSWENSVIDGSVVRSERAGPVYVASDAKLPWFQRAWGIVLLSLIGGVLTQYANLTLGLAK